MKLRIKSEGGIRLIRPSKRHLKLDRQEGGVEWLETLESDGRREMYPRDAEVGKGCHEVERVENPFIRGGPPWLVLKGTRIGAAESYLRDLARATAGTKNGIEVICE